jgi:KTSC domain-containing protein
VDYVPVSSSTISAIAYDSESATLGVRFHNGTEYHYFQVPRDVYEGFLLASSCGAYLNNNLRNAGYTYARVL